MPTVRMALITKVTNKKVQMVYGTKNGIEKIGDNARELRTDHHFVSPTAKLVAHFRRYTDIPYSEEIAQRIDAQGVASKLAGGDEILHGLSSWHAPYLEARYKCIGSQLEREGYRNVMELAAGIAPRGFVMTRYPDVTHVDTDLGGILDERKALFKELGIQKRPNHYFHKVNVLSLDDLEGASRYFEGKPFAVIHEGLLPYLIREEKQAMAKNLHSILKPQNGIYVTPDVVTKIRYKAMIDGNPSLVELFAAISGVTARNMVDNAFEDWEDAVRFYEQSGFSIDRRPYYDGTYELSSIGRLKSDTERVMAMIRPREVWVMRAK